MYLISISWPSPLKRYLLTIWTEEREQACSIRHDTGVSAIFEFHFKWTPPQVVSLTILHHLKWFKIWIWPVKVA